MKTQKLSSITSVILLAVFVMFASDAFAQRARAYERRAGRESEQAPERQFPEQGFCRNLPDLTQEQSDQMDAIRLNTMKQNQQLRNQLGEKHAQLRTLSSSDQPDTRKINQTIDEISALRSDIMKNRMASDQEIRKLLNDEQRIVFDSRGPGNRGYGMHRNRENIDRGPGFRGDCPYRR